MFEFLRTKLPIIKGLGTPLDAEDWMHRQRHFLKGLNFGLKVGLVAHDFSNFQSLVNKTLLIEEERMKLGEDRKHKMNQNAGGPSQRQHLVLLLQLSQCKVQEVKQLYGAVTTAKTQVILPTTVLIPRTLLQ
ncbi:hypothetical protein E2562_003122 [Oryza meyeriana var. granulata]|uniref:Uncharacterized protein n=1 Tax=Oryza meyeriana var. granulata TaxID=110450 RepID=A0A6G1E9H9_9ORYZ|nr:hypothetical protein E2562_003122 [Oryza meyeriana var. granulata]